MSEMKMKVSGIFRVCTPELRRFLKKHEVEYLYQLFFLSDLKKDQNYGLRKEVDLIIERLGIQLPDFDLTNLTIRHLKAISLLFDEGLICETTHRSFRRQMHGFLCE